MNKGTKVLIILTAIVIGIILIISYLKDGGNSDNEMMKCIANNSLLIVSKTCSHCANQLKILGDSKDKFEIIYIDEAPEVIDQYGITGVPAWVINGRVYSGVKSINGLKKLTGC